ncbi:hypothetical protein PP737_004956 [Serratia marcescens]
MKRFKYIQVRILASDRSGSVYFNGQQKGFRSALQVDGVNLGAGKLVQVTPQGGINPFLNPGRL